MSDEIVEKPYELNRLLQSDLELGIQNILYAWRNSERVRNASIGHLLMPKERYFKWLKESIEDPYWFGYIFSLEKYPIGFGSIHCDHIHRFAELSFYIGSESHLGQGHGEQLLRLLMEKAFDSLHMNKIYGKVIEVNVTSHRLHKKMGFYLEGVFVDHIERGPETMDLFVYGMTKSEWDGKSRHRTHSSDNSWLLPLRDFWHRCKKGLGLTEAGGKIS